LAGMVNLPSTEPWASVESARLQAVARKRRDLKRDTRGYVSADEAGGHEVPSRVLDAGPRGLRDPASADEARW